MAFSLKNRAGMTTATTGTGTITLGSAIGSGAAINSASWQTFAAAGAANAVSVRYLILDSNGAWEYGPGTYTSSGTTLTRASPLDGTVAGMKSSTGSTLSLTGTAQVFIAAVAEDIPPFVFTQPQGRLTLQAATAVMTTTQIGQTAVYYYPYIGIQLPVYVTAAQATIMADFSAMSIVGTATTNTTKNPAAIGASKVNDWFVWDDAGTLRLGHGVDWTNDTTRATGHHLVSIDGIWRNNNSITNGASANRGTWVGTTRSNASSTLDWQYPTIGAPGVPGFFGVWNEYNRVEVLGIAGDSTASWTYNSVTPRQTRANSAMQVTFVSGAAEDAFYAQNTQSGLSGGAFGITGVGYDSTSAFSGISSYLPSGSVSGSAMGSHGVTAAGVHFFAACEACTSAATSTFYGNPLSGLLFRGRF
jgi:hypothetical protein